MQQAVTTPVGRMVLFGAIALALGAVRVTRDHAATYQLALAAPEEADAFYLTRWQMGNVTVTFDDGALQPITYRTRAHVYDGCYWQGTETLLPISRTQFAYEYSEQILSCDQDAVPLRKTPRKGIVTASKI